MWKRFIYWLGVSSSAVTVIAGIMIPCYKQYLSDMNYENYFQQNWVTLVGLLGLITTLWVTILEKKKDSAKLEDAVIRIKNIEEYLQAKDMEEMDVEILHAMCWWISSLNNTDEERIAYINHYFPRNKQKIISYLSLRPDLA